jgi:hypothetical protein
LTQILGKPCEFQFEEEEGQEGQAVEAWEGDQEEEDSARCVGNNWNGTGWEARLTIAIS